MLTPVTQDELSTVIWVVTIGDLGERTNTLVAVQSGKIPLRCSTLLESLPIKEASFSKSWAAPKTATRRLSPWLRQKVATSEIMQITAEIYSN